MDNPNFILLLLLFFINNNYHRHLRLVAEPQNAVYYYNKGILPRYIRYILYLRSRSALSHQFSLTK